MDKADIQHILIRATNWVGDAVMTLPALEAVKKNFPQSALTVLARPWVREVYENHPDVERVILMHKGAHWLENVGEQWKTIKTLRRRPYDLAILFQNAFEAGLLSFLGNARYRLGYRTDGRGFLLTHAIAKNAEIQKQHQVEYYLYLLRALGWKAQSKDPRLFIAAADRKAMRVRLEAAGIGDNDLLIVLSPGAIYGPAKRWPPERFAAIGDLAVAHWQAKVLIIGSPGEKKICEQVRGSMRHPSLNWAGETSLREVMAAIDCCQYFLTNDSGLMHVAAALDKPMAAIFGSTDPIATGPRSSKARIVRQPLDCSPCFRAECQSNFRCMLAIEPLEVWNILCDLRKEYP